MRTIICKDYDDMSKTAAKLVAAQLLLKPNSVLGLATGSTPIGMYAELVNMYNQGQLDFSTVTTFNLDEYYPISKQNDQSYYFFMNTHLYSKVNLQNINIPNGSASSYEQECADYDEKIRKCGGIDLQILGIGGNGHIGFNEPADELICETHLTDLTQDTIDANSRFFSSPQEVPKQALTMGMGSIFMAKKIILMASGKSKQEPIKKLLAGKLTTSLPASMLNMHSDTIVIADEEAMS